MKLNSIKTTKQNDGFDLKELRLSLSKLFNEK